MFDFLFSPESLKIITAVAVALNILIWGGLIFMRIFFSVRDGEFIDKL